jgi:ATP-dependent Clp protease ATP-binding subunit ClpA
MTKQTYRLFCSEIDEIVSVKSFDQDTEAETYNSLKKYLADSPASLNVAVYKQKVVDTLLVDASSYYSFLGEDTAVEVKHTIIDALYTTVVEAYPHFEFEFICNDINSNIAFEQMRTLFKEHIAGIGAEPKAAKKVTSLKNLKDLLNLSDHLTKNVIGQDEACEKTVNAIKLMIAGLHDFSAFFYVGPTGVGKTKLAKTLGEKYSGKFFKINCGEYSSPHDYAKLIGAPPGYLGHSESSLLGEKAEQSNSWVILFDEIEKANEKFYDFLLSLLDDGTCTDNLGNTLDFTKSIFIFTTNAGLQDNKIGSTRVGYSKDKITYEESRDNIVESIKKKFSPEFMNRIDEFIFFNKLNEKDLREICKLELRQLPINKTKALMDYIISNSNHSEYGARNIAKFIKNKISTIVADAILRKQLPTTKKNLYTIMIKDGTPYISNIYQEKPCETES